MIINWTIENIKKSWIVNNTIELEILQNGTSKTNEYLSYLSMTKKNLNIVEILNDNNFDDFIKAHFLIHTNDISWTLITLHRIIETYLISNEEPILKKLSLRYLDASERSLKIVDEIIEALNKKYKFNYNINIKIMELIKKIIVININNNKEDVFSIYIPLCHIIKKDKNIIYNSKIAIKYLIEDGTEYFNNIKDYREIFHNNILSRLNRLNINTKFKIEVCLN